MNNIQKKIINNDSKIIEYYQNAKEIWEEIDIDDINLSKELHLKQPSFESDCGGNGVGQEMMAWSGIMHHMNKEESDIESAKKIYKALSKSNCTNEVKISAGDAGKYFGLN